MRCPISPEAAPTSNTENFSRGLTRSLKTRSNIRWPPHQRLIRAMSCRFRFRNLPGAESSSSGFNTRPCLRSEFTSRSVGITVNQPFDNWRKYVRADNSLTSFFVASILQDQNDRIVIPTKVHSFSVCNRCEQVSKLRLFTENAGISSRLTGPTRCTAAD